jgi:hypothetical protein
MAERKGSEKKAAGMSGTTKGSGKRTLIAPKGDKRYVRRDAKGRITESDDQARSLRQDVQKSAKTKVKPGHGDEGDQPRRKGAGTKKAPAKTASAGSASSRTKKGGATKS